MKGTLKIPETFQETFSLDSVVQVITLVQSLNKKETRELMAKINFGQTSPSQLYQIAQVNQDIKVIFVWSKKKAISKN